MAALICDQLYTDEIPLFSVPYADLIDLVVRREVRPERPEEEDRGRLLPDKVWELAEQCWVTDPHKRPTATQIHDAIKHMLSDLPQEPLNETTTVSSLDRTPSYSVEPGLDEQWLVIHARSLPQATGTFIVTSSNGNAKMRITAQEDEIDLPVYGTGDVVAGTIEVTKTENISSVDVTVAC